MKTIPHIETNPIGCSSDNWCVHYAGFANIQKGLEKITHCEAGVEYDSVKKEIDFTYSRGEGITYKGSAAYPCFKYQTHLTDGCQKCRFKTPEEIKAHHDETMAFVTKMDTARKAIVTDLYARYHDHDKTVFAVEKSRAHRWHHPQDNYFCGAGIMKCPCCADGKLRYSRAAYNGHIHAHCSTDGCVSWME